MNPTHKSTYILCSISVLVLCLSLVGSGMAQVPKKLNYQGYLQDSLTGEPVTGTVQMEFALYDVPTEGSPLWSEAQQVDVNDGRYSVHLGTVTPLILTEAKPYYLRISIDGEVLTDDNGQEYREELTSGLYAVFLEGESGESPANNADFPRLLSLSNPPSFHLSENTFYGMYAGASTTTGRQNTFIGHETGLRNITGDSNTFVGDDAGRANTDGYENTFIGHDAGRANTDGYKNTFLGDDAGRANIGHSNTFVGDDAGRANMSGYQNTFLGSNAGQMNTSSSLNTFLGYRVGREHTNGAQNTFVGSYTGEMNWQGSYNTFLGSVVGRLASGGSYNTFVGFGAGLYNQGSRNVFLGSGAGRNETGSNKLWIHNSDSSPALIYGDFAARYVRIHNDLQYTGTLSHVSDQRLKDVQQAFTSGLETIEHIQPVSYRYKAENPLNLPPDKDYVGVIAQELRQVLPEAVEEGEDGYLMVNNEPIIWTMLNAIKELKAQDDVLKAQNETLKSQNEALKAQNEALKARDEALENALKAQNEMMKKEIELLKKALGQ